MLSVTITTKQLPISTNRATGTKSSQGYQFNFIKTLFFRYSENQRNLLIYHAITVLEYMYSYGTSNPL